MGTPSGNVSGNGGSGRENNPSFQIYGRIKREHILFGCTK
jgi:hypothetical protein